MRKFADVKHGDRLTPVEVRFVRVLSRLIEAKGRGPTVSEVEEVWSGCRSGIVEYAHACRAKGALSWQNHGKRMSWATMCVTEHFRSTYGLESDVEAPARAGTAFRRTRQS